MRIAILLAYLLLISNSLHSNTYKKYFKYADPLPGAKLVNKNAGIIITPNESLNKESLFQNGAITLKGTLSGEIRFSLISSDDNKTIIIKPLSAFALGETITIKFNSVIRTLKNRNIEAFSYNFEIESKEVFLPKNYGIESELAEIRTKYPTTYNNSMITEFPQIAVNYYNAPSKGHIFLSNIAFSPSFPNVPHLIILNNNGQPFYSKQMTRPSFDFNVQPDNNLTYYTGTFGGKYYEMDTNYNVIDSFSCGLGDSTDLHELRILPNGHALLMSYDPQPVDMSKIVEGGNPDAIVIGLIIQELDTKKNVVFRWRSWDHFQITDATHEDLTDTLVDYSHGNAIEHDYDGHLMISSRHMDEITKINRETGEIIWRLGGENNQFTFVNDPDRFSYQHAIRRIGNGNITLYDNGNYHTPPYSRAIEYHLDETNKIATLVWQYRNTPDIYGPAMGFVQRLDNGNTLISWGAAWTTITEVKYDGTKVLEISLMPQGIYTYRAFKYNWKQSAPSGQLIPQAFTLFQNYPNPFNPGTTIKFGIPNISGENSPIDTKISVFNMLGQEVAVLLNEPLLPDTYSIDFDGTSFASGVYFYRITTPLFKETKRMVLVK